MSTFPKDFARSERPTDTRSASVLSLSALLGRFLSALQTSQAPTERLDTSIVRKGYVYIPKDFTRSERPTDARSASVLSLSALQTSQAPTERLDTSIVRKGYVYIPKDFTRSERPTDTRSAPVLSLSALLGRFLSAPQTSQAPTERLDTSIVRKGYVYIPIPPLHLYKAPETSQAPTERLDTSIVRKGYVYIPKDFTRSERPADTRINQLPT